MTEKMSHSRGRTIGECGHRYFLKYRAGVPERSSWALVGGRAFHSWCQDFELSKLVGGEPGHAWAYYFGTAVADEMESAGSQPEDWRATGKLKSRPDGEGFSYWLHELGPKMIELYEGFDWGEWKIAHTIPDFQGGLTAGIEYPLKLDNWHGYVDQIREDKHGNLLAVDLKTGKRMYKTTQLEEYGAAGKKLGLRIVYGGYYNARKGEFEHKPLRWTTEQFDEYVTGRHTLATSGVYLPNVGDHCGWCPVRDHCSWV